MENRFIEIQTTDDVIASVMNEKIIDVGNELITEHNENMQNVAKLITVSSSPPSAPDPGDNWYKIL